MYQRKTDELSLAAVMVLLISVKVSLFLGVDEFLLVVSCERLLSFFIKNCLLALLTKDNLVIFFMKCNPPRGLLHSAKNNLGVFVYVIDFIKFFLI